MATRTGTSSSDNFNTGTEADTFHSMGLGSDVVNAGSGNDTINAVVDWWVDTYDGGLHQDTLSYTGNGGAVTVRLGESGGWGSVTAVFDGPNGFPMTRKVADIRSIENVKGSNYNDTITGNSDTNFLYGGTGRDTIDGGGGSDSIIGGRDSDTLWGGAHTDTFVYGAANESSPAAPDTVMDFVFGLDRFDFRGIDADTTQAGDQAFTFIASQGFSGEAGELRQRLSVNVADQPGAMLEADVNGDAVADLAILVTGPDMHQQFSLSDFLL